MSPPLPRRYLLFAVLLGVQMALAFPPINFLPSLYVGFAGIGWLLYRCDGFHGRRALAGMLFALGFHLAGLYWVGNAILIGVENAGLGLAGAIVFGLALYQALFGAAALWLAGFARNFATRMSALVPLWAGGEWLRGHGEFGFPWNLSGYAWESSLSLLQFGAIGGIYAVSVLATLSACLVGCACAPALRIKNRLFALGAGLSVLVLCFAWGYWRLDASETQTLGAPLKVRIVQPAVPQSEKWQSALQLQQFRQLLWLSATSLPADTHMVVWPEAASFFPLDSTPQALRAIAQILPNQTALAAGSIRRISDSRAANSLFIIDGRGNLRGQYDKIRLVPFGEYVPFENLLPFDKLTEASGNFSPGSGPVSLELPNAPVSFAAGIAPAICFDIIFPETLVDKESRPSAIVNVTNDAWYGRSSGPWQHLAITRMRAIEQGLPVIRAANTGISAGFDAKGRLLGSIALDDAGVLDLEIPPPGLAPSVYALWGNAVFWGEIFFVSVLFLLLHWRAKSPITGKTEQDFSG